MKCKFICIDSFRLFTSSKQELSPTTRTNSHTDVNYLILESSRIEPLAMPLDTKKTASTSRIFKKYGKSSKKRLPEHPLATHLNGKTHPGALPLPNLMNTPRNPREIPRNHLCRISHRSHIRPRHSNLASRNRQHQFREISRRRRS